MVDLSPKQEWNNNAHYANSDLFVAKKIARGVTKMAEFQPATDILEAFGLDKGKALSLVDWGAGMLRNTVGLLEMSPLWGVTAYDSPQMLARGVRIFNARLRPHSGRYRLCSVSPGDPLDTAAWPGRLCYDAIIAVLALQHLDEAPLAEWLRIFARHTGKLCIYGRRSLDDLEVRPNAWTNCWPAILQVWEPERVFVVGGYNKGEQVPDFLQGDAEDHFGAVLKRRE